MTNSCDGEMTPKAKKFVEANRKSPIIYGAVTYVPGEDERPENVTGCRFTLDDGQVFTLKSADLHAIEAPRWKI